MEESLATVIGFAGAVEFTKGQFGEESPEYKEAVANLESWLSFAQEVNRLNSNLLEIYSSGLTLEETLKKQGVKGLRLTGCVTHICILFTASDAVLRDYAVAVVEDGVAGLAKEDHDAALRIMKNVMGVKIT